MNFRAGLLLPALAGSLFLLLAAEWLLPGPAGLAWQPPPGIPSGRADASTDADISQWAATILARPLLAQSRRPVPQASDQVSDVLPRLSAIIVIGGARHAIFVATGQKPQMVEQGGQIGVYQIKIVAPDKVDLLGPNGPITLKLQYLPTAPARPATSQ